MEYRFIFGVKKTKNYFSEEICTAEEFTPSCGANEVVVMTSAVYGRMQIGRCAPQDFGHIGCRNDALAQLDRECSGHRSCSVEVTNRILSEDEGSCLPFVVGYLEAEYEGLEGTHYTDTGAFRDQNLGEGRGQKTKGPSLITKCKAVRGKLSRVPPWLFYAESFKKMGYIFARALGKQTIFQFFSENFYNFHPPTATQTP